MAAMKDLYFDVIEMASEGVRPGTISIILGLDLESIYDVLDQHSYDNGDREYVNSED